MATTQVSLANFDPSNQFAVPVEILMSMFQNDIGKPKTSDLQPYKTRTAMRYYISLDPNNIPEKYDFLTELVNKILSDAQKTIPQNQLFEPFQLFINYYRNGSDSCAMHSHPCRQMTVSFGSIRTMKVNSKMYELKNGSSIFLHGQKHGILKTEESGQRISFNLFFTTDKENQGANG